MVGLSNEAAHNQIIIKIKSLVFTYIDVNLRALALARGSMFISLLGTSDPISMSRFDQQSEPNYS